MTSTMTCVQWKPWIWSWCRIEGGSDDDLSFVSDEAVTSASDY